MLDACLNIVGALARSELDDAKVGETVDVERIFGDDGLNLRAAVGDGEDDAAVTRDLPAGDEEIAGSVVLLKKPDVRPHLRVDPREVGFVDEFDHKHGASPIVRVLIDAQRAGSPI